MPIWTVTSSPSIDAVILTRTMLAQARHDPNVRDTSLSYDGTTRIYTLRVDTGENPRPSSEELWQFLQTHAQGAPQLTDPPYPRRYGVIPQGWVNPLRRNIDYQSTARRTFLVEDLPPEHTPLTTRAIVGFSRLLGSEAPSVPPEVAQGILDQYIANPGGREHLGGRLGEHIRNNLDMTSIARRLFPVQQLPDGALPFYGPDRPVWLVEGIWLQNSETGLVGQVIVVEPDHGQWSVHLDTWPTGTREVIPNLIGFDRAWNQVSDPRPDGLPWWERLED